MPEIRAKAAMFSSYLGELLFLARRDKAKVEKLSIEHFGLGLAELTNVRLSIYNIVIIEVFYVYSRT